MFYKANALSNVTSVRKDLLVVKIRRRTCAPTWPLKSLHLAPLVIQAFLPQIFTATEPHPILESMYVTIARSGSLNKAAWKFIKEFIQARLAIYVVVQLLLIRGLLPGSIDFKNFYIIFWDLLKGFSFYFLFEVIFCVFDII